MERLRLLPKFLLVSLMFLLPLALVTGLLFAELQKSIALAQLERDGLRAATAVEQVRVALLRHQMLRYMSLNGNAKVQPQVAAAREAVNKQVDALGREQDLLDGIGLADAVSGMRKEWESLQARSDVKARDDFAAHAALATRVEKLKDEISNRSSLRLDPEVNTHYLALALLDNIPAVAGNIATLSGRGASYIDTGLLEANEDVMLASIVTAGKIELAQLGDKLNALFAAMPGWKTPMEQQLAALPASAAFFERATNEVLKSVDQSSGEQFAGAGIQAIDQLQNLSAAATGLLDAQLQQRLSNFSWRRNLIMTAVVAVLLVAAYLLAGFYLSTREEVATLTDAVESTASGDLRPHGISHGKDEISTLANAFSGMNVSLSHLIAEVRHSAGIIAGASSEIAVGNGDLSRRTESQAASLQVTSSSMEALIATVRANAQNAGQANELAQSASHFALKGGEVVSDIVDTMASITHSSERIMGIIGVIDSIAFQTNILALNAAVEAARAGEQGRGFAVVASEVRTLAQRSAAAAREIKELIDDSASKVELGGQKVQGAGQSMNDIVRSIQEVVDIMARIAASSQEQSTGIGEVAAALSNIDNMTQENAALVEEAASAAESLQHQARLLAEAVSVFKIGEEGRGEVLPAPAVISSRRIQAVGATRQG